LEVHRLYFYEIREEFMPSTVYFQKFSASEESESANKKLKSLFIKAGFQSIVQENDLVAIKLHFGETGNKRVIAPRFVKPFVEMVEQQQGIPFLTDTCVLYKSRRSDAVNHLKLAHENGYTLEATGAPVIITDGLMGSNETEVEIPGKLFQKVSVATDAVLVNSIIALAHVTGHLATGLGGTLKNLGMGLASRKGKLRQHSGIKPQIVARKCTGCQVCVRWCPENAIRMENDIAVINYDRCIGCGQCLAVCRFSAVTHNWSVDSADLQQRLAEHALGVVMNKRDKVGFVNFLTMVTKDCDCTEISQSPLFPDIGVIASTDPVAVDAAALALIEKYNGKSLSQFAHPALDCSIQLKHAASIGLGQLDYEIIPVGESSLSVSI
jgi:uncharacterized Fe-S center protein